MQPSYKLHLNQPSGELGKMLGGWVDISNHNPVTQPGETVMFLVASCRLSCDRLAFQPGEIAIHR